MHTSWLEEFFRLSLSADEKCIQDAHLLKCRNMPSRLYKYQCAPCETNRNIKSLEKNVVWLSPASRFNDPYDSSLFVDIENILNKFKTRLLSNLPTFFLPEDIEDLETCDDVVSTIAAIVHKRDPNLAAIDAGKFINGLKDIYIQKLREPLDAFSIMFQTLAKVCCFSADSLSLPMWAHYADAHAGFCIEYTLDSLTFLSEVKRHLYPVRYHRSRFEGSRWFEASRPAKNPELRYLSWTEISSWRLHTSHLNGNTRKSGA